MTVVEQSGMLSSDEAFKLISPVIIELLDERLTDPRVNENVSEKLGLSDMEVKTKDWKIRTKLWLVAAPLVGEFDPFKISSRKYGNSISYDVERTHIWSWMSSKAKMLLDKINEAEGIPEALMSEFENVAGDLGDQAYEIAIAENQYYTKLLTEGFSVTKEYWPGSAVYDGKSLFNSAHIIASTGATYSNIVDNWAGKHAVLSAANVLKAVEMLRNMKDGLGVRVQRPTSGVYDLIVPVELEGKAIKEVLSANNWFSPYNYSGTEATNNNFVNLFVSADWFKVNLVVLETLNQPDENWVTIGGDKQWFVLNREWASLRKAFRKLKMWDVSVKMYYDDESRAVFVTAEKFFWAQALYPEIIVWSKWDESTI